MFNNMFIRIYIYNYNWRRSTRRPPKQKSARVFSRSRTFLYPSTLSLPLLAEHNLLLLPDDDEEKRKREAREREREIHATTRRRPKKISFNGVRRLPWDTQTNPNLLPTATALATFSSGTNTAVVPPRGRVPRSRTSTRQTRSTLESRGKLPFATCSFQL